jgi:hypothetical protein
MDMHVCLHQHHHSNKDMHICLSRLISMIIRIVTLSTLPTHHKSKIHVLGRIRGGLGRICHPVINLKETITTTITHLLGAPCNLVHWIEIIMEGKDLNHGVQIIVQIETLGMVQVEISQILE